MQYKRLYRISATVTLRRARLCYPAVDPLPGEFREGFGATSLSQTAIDTNVSHTP